ncbi:MAG: metallophosphoesterase [Chlorobium sp.]|uniref:metallophosphoesterase n=1 Tax=Chlorobium sp. TaxID=1095 RepID=UPI0025BA9312|nr:metallophosphoesterase [Chlorobium sp.]MCF8383548.1 metallophosphoesterase [Chlorobium sp.]
MRIGLITDMHFKVNDKSGAAFTATPSLRACIEDFRNSSVNFVLQLGDMINGTPEQAKEELRQALPMLNEYEGTIHHVIGNHCLAVPQKALLLSLGMERAYYSFRAERFRFIVLDGMDVSVLNKPETDADLRLRQSYLARPELHDYCGAVGERQIEWLQRELQEATTENESVIVVCHFPLHPATTDTKHGLLWNHQEVRKLLGSYPAVKACIGGHYHYGGYSEENGIHYLVLPAFVNRSEHPESAWAVADLCENRLRLISSTGGRFLYDLELNRNTEP